MSLQEDFSPVRRLVMETRIYLALKNCLRKSAPTIRALMNTNRSASMKRLMRRKPPFEIRRTPRPHQPRPGSRAVRKGTPPARPLRYVIR